MRLLPLLFLSAAVCAAAFEIGDDATGEWRLSLDGAWRFTINPGKVDQDDSQWDSITVPGNWDTLERYSQHVGKGWYRRAFTVSDEWRGKKVRLRFDAVYHEAQVRLNGDLVGRHIGGYTPFEFDVTDKLKRDGTNIVTVCADNTYHRGAWWPWGGISRSVTLIANNDVRLSSQHIRTEPDLQTGDAKVFVRYKLLNSGDGSKTLDLASKIDNVNDANLVKRVTVAAHSETQIDLTTRLPRQRVRLWDFDHPNLYRLTTEVSTESGVQHVKSDRFGIRKVEVTPDGLLLNGERVRLVGFNRVSDHRTYGNTEPGELVQSDVDMMKRAGANMSRIMHTPQAPDLLDYLDEKGMLIFEEIPVWGADDPQIKKDSPLPKQWLAEMIDRDYNHPCIIGWSVGNELSNHFDYVKSMIDYVRTELDSHRLLTYASFTGRKEGWGPLNDPITVCDVILYNCYTSPTGFAKRLHELWPGKPIFFSEFGSKQFGEQPDATIPKLDERWDEWRHLPYVIGAALWTFNDYRSNHRNTPPSGNRAWGVVDVWRRPKAAYAQVRTLFSPVHSLTASNLTVVIEPRGRDELPSYTLRDYRITWKLLRSDHTVSTNGTIQLPTIKPGDAAWSATLLRDPPSDASELAVGLLTPTGYVVHEWRGRL